MPNSYTLANPYIQGKFKNSIKANNSLLAAQIFYKNLSEHFNNAVPTFNFTIQKGTSGNGTFYHFQSNESRDGNEVNFSIKPYNVINENMESYKTKLASIKKKISQQGGKHKKHRKKSKKQGSSDSSDSSESSSSSDSDKYIKRISTYTPMLNQPIYYWWYDPSIYKLESVFIPTFYPYITPLIEYSISF